MKDHNEIHSHVSHWPRFASQDQYQEALIEFESMYAARWQWGQHLEASCERSGCYRGYCGLCARGADFAFSAGTGGPVNLREEMFCSECGLNARLRVVLHCLRDACPPGSADRIYLTEQTTVLYKYVRDHWPRAIGSEYFGQSAKPRLEASLKHLISKQEILRHEDVTSLSFHDGALDVVITCDVLEHVPNYRQALLEFARVLKLGGRLLLMVPFLD